MRALPGWNGAGSSSEPSQHLAFDLRDLLAQALDLGEGPAALLRLGEDRVDLAEDVADLRVSLDRSPRAQLARVPAAERIVTQLARLVEQHPDLVLVALQELPDGAPHLRPLRRVAPEHVLEERDVLVSYRAPPLEVGVRAEHADGLRVAAVGADDVLPLELATEIGHHAQDIAGNREGRRLGLRRGELRERQRRAVRGRARLEE